jgi:branched-chain amino acid transport system substrate-binding protein
MNPWTGRQAGLWSIALPLAMACSGLGAAEARLALILARTGIGADENLPAEKAAELAVAELNGAGGLLGRTVRLVLVDDESTPLGARKAAEYAVSQGVIGVIGAFRSSHCLAMIPVIREARIPMITPTATNPEVTRGNAFIFRACFTDEAQGKAMARFARRDLGARSAAVLTNMTENYSITLARTFAAGFADLGGTMLGQGEYQGSAVDFAAPLAGLGRSGADVVFVPGYPRDSGLLISQAVSSGIHSVFLGGDAWDLNPGVDPYAGTALEGAYHSTQWYADAPAERNRALRALYRKRYGAGGFSSMQIPLTYDSIMLFADAARRANSLDPGKIAQALQQTRGFKGAAGSITFDPDRNPLGKEVVILKYRHGAWHYFKSIRPGG